MSETMNALAITALGQKAEMMDFPRPVREGVLRLMAAGHLNMVPLISHTIPWRDSEGLYNKLFTPERDRFNGIIIDWRQ